MGLAALFALLISKFNTTKSRESILFFLFQNINFLVTLSNFSSNIHNNVAGIYSIMTVKS